MPNLTRVSQQDLYRALNGDNSVCDAVGNALNGSAMNAFDPQPSSGSAAGVYASIGTNIYVEITLNYNGGGKPVLQLPFIHQDLSNTRAVICGSRSDGVMISGIVEPQSGSLLLSRYDGANLDSGVYAISGTYQSLTG